MLMGKKITGLIIGVLLCLLLLPGCGREDQKNLLSHKRLGVYLQTEKGDRTVLTDALTAYLGEYLPDTAIVALTTAEAATGPSATTAGPLDYTLTVRLSDIKIKLNTDLDLSDSSVKFQLGRKCSLTLSYRLTELPSGQVKLRGQTQGTADHYNQSEFANRQIVLDFNSNSETPVIEAAMLNAVQNSQLTKTN